ncbi:transmembrane anchor protein [Vibrio parahaemolyticus]|uniref:transmembrane anchor protein n=1 Tax=Vibrio parahaemolyticus TaxID=670 RepID=UPI001A1C0246|nr:transmembrane anchor protein [Vibrio parahaemolyticus]MBE5174325.1 transmembrane anchor protein [Vibrio parahaemolyticus]MDL2002624.1 transmembrane anchor protein [Vibrio parahaemolyticus]HAS6501829.1 transmembrane anchor protein [Vibrio parahaemolyticus]HBC3838693.1 transmembrane anchor protein [Vibrio parahaemolyticus]HCE4544553.1 transmembrane anchor protein [Vibrio parahaemolyticus]
MYNTDMPNRAELPTTKQLVRSTFIALATAIVLLITVILPAEYAIDPTGMGRALGLTEMGEIKAQLAQEAEEDQANSSVVADTKTVQNAPVKAEPEVAPQQLEVSSTKPEVAVAVEPVWKDKIMLSLKPGQGAEVKLVMEKGQVAQFEWVSKGGPVNYDTHGDGNGNSISYEKGRGVPNDQGELEAAFTGNHGWFFRNRNDKIVMVILKTNGDYAEMKRVL